MNLRTILFGTSITLLSACSSVGLSYSTLLQDSEEVLDRHEGMYGEIVTMSSLEDVDGDGDLDLIFTTSDNSTGYEREGVYINEKGVFSSHPYRR